MEKNASIYVAGHNGLIGSALVLELKRRGYSKLLLQDRKDLDLTDQLAVNKWFAQNRPDYVFVAAAKVGGIQANSSQPADFIYDNLAIAMNVVHAAAKHDTKKLLYLGSTCFYPKVVASPIKEESLLTGALEPTSEAYAIAKIVSLKLCEMYRRQHGKQFISAVPCGLYGPGDNFHPQESHVIPALLRKFHEAKTQQRPEVSIWGSGKAKREFLYIDDAAEALCTMMEKLDSAPYINIGCGTSVSIAELAQLIAKVTGYTGRLTFDTSKPDGTAERLLDNSKIEALGWHPRCKLEDGLAKTYQWAVSKQVFESNGQNRIRR